MEQDDDLVPPTVNSGTIGTLVFEDGSSKAANIDLNDWNTPDALARSTAQAQIDTFLVHATIRVNSWRTLRLGARFRYFEQIDRSRYTAFNPRTGQFGYIAEDGAPAVVIPFENRVFLAGQPSGDWRFRSVPLGYRTLQTNLSADYRIGTRSRAHLFYERERIDLNHRERDETDEDRIGLRLTSRALGWATWRFSYEGTRRRGSGFDADSLRTFFVSSLPGFRSLFGPFVPPNGLRQLRRSRLADLDRHALELRVNLLVREDMDVAIAGGYRREDYGVAYGLREEERGHLNLDWNWQLSPRLGAYALFGYEIRRKGIGGINDAGPVSPDPNAGGPVFPFDRAWSLDTRGVTRSIGAGFSLHPLERIEIETDYRFSVSRDEISYELASTQALGTGLSASQAGTALPDLLRRDQSLQTRLRISITDDLSLRLYHRYERSAIRDWHQTGLSPQVEGAVFLSHVDDAFEVNVYGVTLQLRF